LSGIADGKAAVAANTAAPLATGGDSIGCAGADLAAATAVIDIGLLIGTGAAAVR
jgi:hypothetical protein